MAPQDVLNFWFKTAKGKWFTKDAAFDAAIRDQFLDMYRKAVRGETEHWRVSPQGRLAEIIVLDQFPRNMFRETAEAYGSDQYALALAQEAIDVGADKKLNGTERQFLYMPFMHSESSEVHKHAIRLFLSLPPWKWGALFFELRHKNIIDRFGRYPSRNEALGRNSTPDERAFLKKHRGF